MAKFNGHKNWNHWNVSLWIHSDEGLYRMARDLIGEYRSKDIAARAMLAILSESAPQTPDGAPYSVTTIKAAMREM